MWEELLTRFTTDVYQLSWFLSGSEPGRYPVLLGLPRPTSWPPAQPLVPAASFPLPPVSTVSPEWASAAAVSLYWQ